MTRSRRVVFFLSFLIASSSAFASEENASQATAGGSERQTWQVQAAAGSMDRDDILSIRSAGIQVGMQLNQRFSWSAVGTKYWSKYSNEFAQLANALYIGANPTAPRYYAGSELAFNAVRIGSGPALFNLNVIAGAGAMNLNNSQWVPSLTYGLGQQIFIVKNVALDLAFRRMYSREPLSGISGNFGTPTNFKKSHWANVYTAGLSVLIR